MKHILGTFDSHITTSTTTTTTGSTTTTTTLAGSCSTALEGYGSVTVGGQGQPTFHVTNLNLTGAGSLSSVLGSNRIIVFDVGGTISGFRMDTYVSSMVNVTIDGTTAPSPGITLSGGADIWSMDHSNSVAGFHDIIIKGIRFRGSSSGGDGMNMLNGANRIVIDHCSFSNNGDGNCDITTGSHDITVQWCILGNGVDGWSGNMLIAYANTHNISIHHNLFCPKTPGGSNAVGERNPFVHSSDTGTRSDLMIDFRNNVVYNWGRANATGSGYGTGVDYGGSVQCINNYYKTTGPDTSRAIDTDADPSAGSNGQCFASGNVSGNTGINPNSVSNHAAYTLTGNGNTITTQTACAAAASVVQCAGVRPLDSVDSAIIASISLTNC